MKRDEKIDRNIAHADEARAAATDSSEAPRISFIRVIKERRWLVVALLLLSATAIALALIFARGAGSGEGRPVPAPVGAPVPSPSEETSTQSRPGDVTITISPGEIENAQIQIETATSQAGAPAQIAGGVRTTGTVQANEYKETPVFPIAGGIIRQVNAQLGDRVRRGQALAAIFSTELADAQAEYLKMLAELEEHHQHHRRAVELVEIGAISREELEQAMSVYKAAQANVSSARQRLILLGMTPQQINALRSPGDISSIISVTAPVSGTVIDRAVNTGEVVDKGKELFRVADLSTVWVIGQIYENDFRFVRVGTPAAITTTAYPGQSFNGRVSYIDPRVDPNTRTAQVRIEVFNPGGALRLGMFVDVSFGGAAAISSDGREAVAVPRAAVQAIGSKQVVYLATDQAGQFIQREVITGAEAGGMVTIHSGVSAGDRVVTEGSFLLRAESLKLNPAQATSR